MAKRRMGIMLFLLCFCLCLLPCTALAASTSDAKEWIVTDRGCTLTMSYRYKNVSFSGRTVKLYQIADVSSDFRYTLTPDFAASNLDVNGIQTNKEWKVIRSSLEAYILANKTAPVQIVKTDKSGNACFTWLKPGLYLASEVDGVQGDLTCHFDSALVALPGLGTDGLWQYEISVAAKPQVIPPVDPDGKLEFKVLKLWKGDQWTGGRPQQIEVEIFRDGTAVETVQLSEDNQWSYSWTAKDDGASWSVVERNIPEGYAMTLEERGTSFILTNTRMSDPDMPPVEPPRTGDTSNMLLYAVLMFVSGTMLIALGITGKRNRHEETN